MIYKYSLSRRGFLQAGAASTLLSVCPSQFRALCVHPDEIKARFDELRANLLVLVNEERTVEKVPELKLDDLATRVATAHAEEMAKGEFVSHWGPVSYTHLTLPTILRV